MQRSLVRFLLASTGLLVLAFLAALASASTDIPPVSSVFASPDLAHPLTRDRLALCIVETGRAMRLSDREAPQILILQLSRAEARRAGMSNNLMLSNRSKDPSRPHRFYEVWLVGPDGLSDMAQAVVSIFEVHFDVKLTPEQRADTVKRVLIHIGNTVDAKALRSFRSADR
jgi:hypothetical protein